MRIMSNSLHLLSTRSWVQNVYCDTLPEKGRILRASKGFAKHELVCEYEGDIITEDEADIRECDYQKKALPCCMLYFTGKQGEKLVCDPTMRDLPAKYISHCKNPNLYTQLYKTDTGYHIVLAAKVQIEPHEELYFDYFPGKRPDVSFRSYRRGKSPVPSEQPSTSTSFSETEGQADNRYLDQEAEVSGEDSGDEQVIDTCSQLSNLFDNDTDGSLCEEPNTVLCDALNTLRNRFAMYQYHDKVTFLQHVVTVILNDQEKLKQFCTQLRNSSFSLHSDMIMAGRKSTVSDITFVTGIFDELSQIQGVPWCLGLFQALNDNLTINTVDSLTSALNELESPSKHLRSLSNTPTKNKRRKHSMGSETDSIPLSQFSTHSYELPTTQPTHRRLSFTPTQHPVVTERQEALQYLALTYKKNMGLTDTRLDLIPLHLRRPDYLNLDLVLEQKYKHFLLCIPGNDHFSDTFAVNMQLKCSVSIMGVMAVFDTNRDIALPNGSVTESTLLGFATYKMGKLQSIAQSIYNALAGSGVEDTGSCLLLPFTQQGYEEFLKNAEDSEGYKHVGNVDEKTRRKLKLDTTQDRDIFRHIVNWLEELGVRSKPDIVKVIDSLKPGDKMFRIVRTLHTSGAAMRSCVDSAVWYLTMREKYLPSKCQNNISKAAGRFYWHLFNQTLQEFSDTKDIDVEQPNHMEWLIKSVLRPQTLTEKLLITQKVQPVQFANDLCEMLFGDSRRERTLVFYSPQKRCGKSILADAIMKLVNGARLALDHADSREFVISSMADSGCVVIEDPSAEGIKYIDKALRPHLDGDIVQINKKNEPVSEKQFPPVIITSNASLCCTTFHTRAKVYTFSNPIEKAFGNRFVNTIPPTDVAQFIAKYTVFPMCNAIYQGHCELNTCAFLQCTSDTLTGHSPFCWFTTYVCRMHKLNVMPHKYKMPCHGSHIYMCNYERIRPRILGLFLKQSVIESGEMFAVHEHKLVASPGSLLPEDKQNTAKQFSMFIENVVKPLSEIMFFVQQDAGRSDYVHPNVSVATRALASPSVPLTRETYLEIRPQEREASCPPTLLLSSSERQQLFTSEVDAIEAGLSRFSTVIENLRIKYNVLDEAEGVQGAAYHMLTGKTQMTLREHVFTETREEEDMFG